MPKKRLVFLILLLSTLAVIFLFLNNQTTKWKDLNVGNFYSIQYPSNWHTQIQDNNNTLIISTNASSLSTQDYPTNEKARVTVWVIEKKSENQFNTLTAQTIELSKGKIVENTTEKINNMNAKLIVIDNQAYKKSPLIKEYHLFIDSDNSIIEVFGAINRNVNPLLTNYYISLINQIISSIKIQ